MIISTILHFTNYMIILSIAISFIAVAVSSFTLGFFMGQERLKVPKIFNRPPVDKVKVFKKSDPKTFVEKRTEAMDSGKPIIKTFSK